MRDSTTLKNVDLICITETWLQSHIHNNIVSVPGYSIERRDRSNGQHGGVCIYIRNSIKYQVLHDMMNTEIEALWVKLRTSCLPRGISCIILCNLYHPPSGNDQQAINYLYESLTTIEANFPSCGIILLGDFNKLITSRLTNGFKLYQIVKFPTRGQNLLDLIFTNMKEFYKEPIKRPAFGLSDHDTIEVQPLERLQMPKPKLQVNRGI